MNIQLKERKLVNIFYNITNESRGGNCYLCTSLKINDVENKNFRTISGETWYHSNIVSKDIILDAGNYEIQVIYRTNGKFYNMGPRDWDVARLVALVK